MSLGEAVVAVLIVAGLFAAGAFNWFFFEYVLHRWAFHEMKGNNIGSREHLEHHVHASWNMDPLMLLVWFGVLLTGFGWGAGAVAVLGTRLGWAFGAGWSIGYFFYEWHHRAAHLRGPRNAWEAWLRVHHFHHHFGHPLTNQGVSISLWDHVFHTNVDPEVVRVPRRLVMPWLVDEAGEVRPEFAEHYELVGSPNPAERQESIDRARAFANEVPVP